MSVKKIEVPVKVPVPDKVSRGRAYEDRGADLAQRRQDDWRYGETPQRWHVR